MDIRSSVTLEKTGIGIGKRLIPFDVLSKTGVQRVLRGVPK